MNATVHYLTGVSIAAVFQEPLIVIPAAFMSHFVLDALPHFGLEYSKKRSGLLIKIAIIDGLLFATAVGLTVLRYPSWYVLAGIVAFSPDLAWIYRFTVKEKFGQLPPAPSNAFNEWHGRIQKYERWWGIFIEIAVLAILSGVLYFR